MVDPRHRPDDEQPSTARSVSAPAWSCCANSNARSSIRALCGERDALCPT